MMCDALCSGNSNRHCAEKIYIYEEVKQRSRKQFNQNHLFVQYTTR